MGSETKVTTQELAEQLTKDSRQPVRFLAASRLRELEATLVEAKKMLDWNAQLVQTQQSELDTARREAASLRADRERLGWWQDRIRETCEEFGCFVRIEVDGSLNWQTSPGGTRELNEALDIARQRWRSWIDRQRGAGE